MRRLLLVIAVLFQFGPGLAAELDLSELLAYRETFVDNAEPLFGAATLGRSDVWFTELTDGVLRFSNNEKNGALRYIDMPTVAFALSRPGENGTDGAVPFARARVVETGDGAIGLIVGYPRGGDYMVFALGGDQRFSIASKQDGRLRRIHDDTSEAILADGFNDLKVLRVEGELRFEINGQEVYSTPAGKLENAPVGVAVMGQGTFEFESVGVLAPTKLVERIRSKFAACTLPAATANELVVLLGSYEGAALSTATVVGQDEVTSTIAIDVAAGERPIHVVAVTHTPVIWRVGGASERISRFTIVGGAGGVVGVPRDVVGFASGDACFRYFKAADGKEALQAKVASAIALDREVDKVAAAYDPALFRLPSAVAEETPPAGPTGIDPRWHKALLADLDRYYPAGVVTIDPAEVMSAQPAEAYDVLPQTAGLAQLEAEGILLRVHSGSYRIVKPMARFPAGLAGAFGVSFELPKDIPMPAGDPKHSKVVPWTPPVEAGAASRPGESKELRVN